MANSTASQLPHKTTNQKPQKSNKMNPLPHDPYAKVKMKVNNLPVKRKV